MDGCWVLASTISAEAGASLPVQSTLIGLAGVPNGEWIVAFDGPAGQTGNWENMVTAGEMIVFQPAGGGGHITTCVSGSGSTAMLVDNITYVNGSGQVQNSANDGSSNDIIVSAPHAASQEFAGVSASTVVIYELDTPIVTATATSETLAFLKSLSLGALFSATDPASKAITEWQVYDTATSDALVFGGTDDSDHSAATALTTTSLSLVSLLAGSTAATDTLEVRAYNGSYWGDWDSLNVTIAATAPVTPQPPVLETQTANQTWIGGASLSLALPATTFEDPQNEALTYSALLSNGQALPGWLTFNATTDTFSGTAPATAETLTIQVTAKDTSGLSASETFSATVIGRPVVTAQTPNQSWAEGKAFSFTLPANTFTDPQGETLTYTASLAPSTSAAASSRTGATTVANSLPSWLSFNPATDTFSGIAPATTQSLQLDVTATDTSGLSVSDIFGVTVAPPGPVLAARTPNQSWVAGQVVSLRLPLGTFTDPSGEKLTYTAALANGQALPGWLTFNAALDWLSGIAPATAETLNITVTATDPNGLSVADTFAATILAPPTVTDQTQNQAWTEGKAFSLALPANTFTDPQGEALTYAATQANGQALPSWLTFNAATDTFSGTAPARRADGGHQGHRNRHQRAGGLGVVRRVHPGAGHDAKARHHGHRSDPQPDLDRRAGGGFHLAGQHLHRRARVEDVVHRLRAERAQHHLLAVFQPGHGRIVRHGPQDDDRHGGTWGGRDRQPAYDRRRHIQRDLRVRHRRAYERRLRAGRCCGAVGCVAGIGIVGAARLEHFHPDRKSRCSRCKCVIPAEAGTRNGAARDRSTPTGHPRGSGDPSRLGPRFRGDDEKDAFQSGRKCSSRPRCGRAARHARTAASLPSPEEHYAEQDKNRQ